MKKLGNYILVESIDELRGIAEWQEAGNFRVNDMGIFYNASKITYPHVFKYHDPHDSRCMPEYHPCSKDDMLFCTNMEISLLKGKIRNYEELRDKLEKVSE